MGRPFVFLPCKPLQPRYKSVSAEKSNRSLYHYVAIVYGPAPELRPVVLLVLA